MAQNNWENILALSRKNEGWSRQGLVKDKGNNKRENQISDTPKGGDYKIMIEVWNGTSCDHKEGVLNHTWNF